MPPLEKLFRLETEFHCRLRTQGTGMQAIRSIHAFTIQVFGIYRRGEVD